MPAKRFLSHWINRFHNWGKQVSDVLRRLAAGRSVPYAVVYDLHAGFRIPPDFDLSRYKGLALCHTVSDPSTAVPRLIVYWRAEAHWRAQSGSLETDLHLPTTGGKGFVIDVVTERPSWLERNSWLWKGTAITVAAGVFAAVIALRGYVAQALETPDVQISFPDLTRLDLTAGTPFNVAVRVLNDSVYAHTTLTSVTAVAKPQSGGKDLALASEWSSIPRLEAGQSSEITVSGTAPERRSSNGPLEFYDIAVTVYAGTGLVHRNAKLFKTSTSRQIALWPTRIGSTCARVLHGAGHDGKPDDAAQLEVFLLPGTSYPKGAEGFALITSAPDEIKKISVGQYQTAELPPSMPDPAITREVEFRVPKLESLREFPLLVNLEAIRPLQQGQWDRLIACPNLEVGAQ